jgi:hypothetical protein
VICYTAAMKHRKLRIAWSIVWGLAAAALIVLWVRSYWRYERARTDLLRTAECWMESFRGEFGIAILTPCRNLWNGWDLRSHPVNEVIVFPMTAGDDAFPPRVFGLRWDAGPTSVVLFVPCVLVTLVTITLAVAPWLRWRFTLRTLLIATTLIGLFLGLIFTTTR